MPNLDDSVNKSVKIKVIGIGGGCVNTLNEMKTRGLIVADFIAVNTNAADLRKSKAQEKYKLERNILTQLVAKFHLNMLVIAL